MNSSLVADTIDAHGGTDAWRASTALDVTFSAGGLAFGSKGHPRTLRRAQARVATHAQHVDLDVAAWPGWIVRLDPEGVQVIDPAGTSRTRAGVRAWSPRWDRCDLAWFCAQAIWTYISLPFVLADDFHCGGAMPGRRLNVTFAPEIHTHCRTQVLHIGHGLGWGT